MHRHLAALAALASTSAFAQSGVAISGVFDLAVSHVKTHVAGQSLSTTGLYSSGMSSSLLRFEGRESLGGDVYALFRLESGLNLDTGTGLATNTNNQRSGATPAGGMSWNRWAFVGLGSTSLGELRLGRVYTAAFENFTPFDPFLTNGVGASTPISLRLGQRNTQTALNVSNAIDYTTPGYYGKGFFARVTGALGENPSDGSLATSNPRHGGDHGALRVGYAGGAFTVAFSTGLTRNTAGVTPTGNNAGNYLNTNLSGRYDLGFVKLYGQYVTERLDGASAVTGGLTGNPAHEAKTRSFLVGASIPVGLGNIKLSAVQGKLSDNLGTAPEKGRLVVVGYDYFFSKRTNVYTALAHVGNNDRGAYGFATTLPQSSRGESSSSLSAGLRHQF